MIPDLADDAIAVALAYHQAPARYHDLLRGHAPLPKGVDGLLRLAGAPPVEEPATPGDNFVRNDDQTRAAQFFIEQVLLGHDADHYRLLGVNRDASQEQIKEHHRLLMRLFHPDRISGIEEELKAVHASRINLAYNVLRQPASRAAYDATLRQARKVAAFQAPRPQPYLHTRNQPPGILQSMPPLLARNLPQFVLGGVAVVAAVAVTTIYRERPPAGAIGWDAEVRASQRVRMPERPQTIAAIQPAPTAKPRHPRPQTSPSAEKALFDALASPSKPAVPRAVAVGVQKTAPASRQQTAIAAAAPAKPALENSLRPDAGIAPPLKIEASPTANPPQTVIVPHPEPPALSILAEQAAPVVPKPAPPPTRIADADLAGLIAQLSQQYANGNLEGFMALFDESARSEAGGKMQIRNDYANLFRSSLRREIVIWDMNWRLNGDSAKGEGSFHAQVIGNGETVPRTYLGQIKLEVVKHGDAPLITSLKHMVKR
jgi:hypothetical protein